MINQGKVMKFRVIGNNHLKYQKEVASYHISKITFLKQQIEAEEQKLQQIVEDYGVDVIDCDDPPHFWDVNQRR